MDCARLWLGLLMPAVAALDFSYHHQPEMEAFLKNVAQNYSSITYLHSIGKSVQGRVRLLYFPKPLVLTFIHQIYFSFLSPFYEAAQRGSKRIRHCLACRLPLPLCVVLLFVRGVES